MFNSCRHGALRKTRVNWLLRMSSDPELTAEMAQHTKQTLLAVYERPSLQRAMVESMRFWSKFDPHSGRTQSVAPGGCTGTPQAVEDAPKEAAQPDCIKLSGCLWCENHRDVDSLDHIWSLASFCHLKRLELSRVNPVESNGVPPAKHAIDRIVAKLRWFEQSSDLRRGWVTEAEIRISEGDYHSSFNDAIAALEGTA